MDMELARHSPQRAALSAQGERLDDVDLVHPRPPELLSQRSSPTDAGDYSLANEVPLELGDRSEHVEQ